MADGEVILVDPLFVGTEYRTEVWMSDRAWEELVRYQDRQARQRLRTDASSRARAAALTFSIQAARH